MPTAKSARSATSTARTHRRKPRVSAVPTAPVVLLPKRPEKPGAYTLYLERQLAKLVHGLRRARDGDVSIRLPTDDLDELMLQATQAFNGLMEHNECLTHEITRTSHFIGDKGKLPEKSHVHVQLPGAFKDCLESFYRMNDLVTTRTQEIASIINDIAAGNLSHKMLLEYDGRPLQGDTLLVGIAINQLVDRLRDVFLEVTRVAREVGIEGKLGGLANVEGTTGTWRELTEHINLLTGNLTTQVRNIALVTTAVANGDLSQKISVEVRGEFLELKKTINTMVDQLGAFASEVMRVAEEVGTEGKLGGQAEVRGVSGTWKDLTDNVNLMASNLTSQVRGIVKVVTAVAEGDLSEKLVVEAKGEIGALAYTINNMTDTLRTFAEQVTSVAREVGIEGKLGGQAKVPGAAGTWRDLIDNVNVLAGNLTNQVRNIAVVTTAVAEGDLSQTITVDARGEILELKDTINAMVGQLQTFAREVTRVAREVGTEGKLGGQAQVPGLAGTWKDLTDNVNLMASNLTNQVRGIVKVVTAVAEGELSRKLVVEAKGEIAALADTINNMTGTLGTFAQQVTTVAREVGFEGKLGGQAKVPGATGTWRNLTDNVNQLAGNLTAQVRAISEVANAVTKGDLTRTIDVIARGELLSLKDTINQMIANLRDTTKTNQEQDWLKTNLANFAQMMQGQSNLENLATLIMSELTPLLAAQQGTFFIAEDDKELQQPMLRLLGAYAFHQPKHLARRYVFGEGIIGQCAVEKKIICIDNLPEDYATISSSLGKAAPRNVLVLPIVFEDTIKGVLELGSLQPFKPIHINFLEQLSLSIGVVFNMISASTRTKELLAELKGSHVELEKRTSELEEKATLLEVKNREIAETSGSLEEKAKQLALVSKYKSEFLTNMSHELRTPLNSLLILAKILSDNEEANLSAQQVEYAKTIYAAGNDLLGLINQILDLSKIEAGKMQIECNPVNLQELQLDVQRNFSQVGGQRRIGFKITIDPKAPAFFTTDEQRLQQILKNLLSNAFKFTEQGEVRLDICVETDKNNFTNPILRQAAGTICFTVSDTGIGIPEEKQQFIFEAFQQADASTSRTYGGTGLGLTISRELTRLLGGEIYLKSEPQHGSIFTLYLPLTQEDLTAQTVGGYGDAYRTKTIVKQPEIAIIGHKLPASHVRPQLAHMPLHAPPDKREIACFKGRKILLVDDDVRNLFAVTCVLERTGIQVLPARGGREGLTFLAEHPDIDVILMDIMMPEMDGYQATRRIRQMDEVSDIPVIALTAKAMPGDREKCMEAGCDDFIAKPVQADLLIQTIQNFLTQKQARS